MDGNAGSVPLGVINMRAKRAPLDLWRFSWVWGLFDVFHRGWQGVMRQICAKSDHGLSVTWQAFVAACLTVLPWSATSGMCLKPGKHAVSPFFSKDQVKPADITAEKTILLCAPQL